MIFQVFSGDFHSYFSKIDYLISLGSFFRESKEESPNKMASHLGELSFLKYLEQF